MDILRHDLRFAFRLMARQPGTTAIVVLTLALAIGANTAVFTAVHAALVRPLPFPDPGRLVMVWEARTAEGVTDNVVSGADFLDWVRLNETFSGLAAYDGTSVDLTGLGDPVRVDTAAVTAAFFDVFAVRALHGRTFAPGEDVAGANRLIVLGHAFWLQRFGGDPAVVGRTLEVNGRPFEIVGVLPPDAVFPGAPADLYAPLVLQTAEQPASRGRHHLTVYGRLKTGTTLERARADMDRISDQLAAAYPEFNRTHRAHVVGMQAYLAGPLHRTFGVLAAAVGFLLIIACVNVANLLLARAAARRREVAVRVALGAGRWRVLRQALTESAVLVTIGGALGLLVASWSATLLAQTAPPVLRAAGSALGPATLGITLLACAVVTLLAGGLPAWQMAATDPGEPLKDGGRSPAGLRRRLRAAFIVGEVAMTALLLVAAGLTLRSFQRVLSEPTGFEAADRLTLRLQLPRSRYPDAAAAARFYGELEDRLQGTPGVRAAGGVSHLPLSGSDNRWGIAVDGLARAEGDPPVRAHQRTVTPGYLSAVGARLVAGRGITEADTASAPPVIVVNETMARRYWPGATAIGQRVRRGDEEAWREVVGVVGDIRHWGFDQAVNPEMYLPHTQDDWLAMTLVLSLAAEPATVLPAVERHVRVLDPQLPLFQVRTMEEVVGASVAVRRRGVILLGLFGSLALVLAGAGIYGVMAHLVSRRTAEIGIRLTLGAHPRTVMRQVLTEALSQTGVGLALGLGASLVAMQALRATLYGIEPTDPLTLAGVAVVLLAVTLLAVAVPARRAMRVDPVAALRAN